MNSELPQTTGTLPDPEVEALAKKLCDERWGEGAYDSGDYQRSYWRRQARRLLSK